MRTGWQAYAIRTFLHGAFLILLLVFETSFFSVFPLRGVTPDLVLIAAISVGVLRGYLSGAAFGFAGGMLADILTGRLIGLGALILAAVGAAAGALGQRIESERISVVLLFNVAGAALYLSFYGAGAWAFGVHMPVWEGVAALAPWLMAYNGALSLLLHPFLRRAYRFLDAVYIVPRAPTSGVQGR